MHVIEGSNADEVWRAAAEKILQWEGVIHQPTRRAVTLELFHTTIVISSPFDRWVLSRLPPINPAFALAEVVWILCGRRDSGFLNFWNPVLPKFCGRGATYHGAYGDRLRFHFGFDQLQRAQEVLRAQPHNRQIVLQIWDPQSDLPSEAGAPRDDDIPCNVCSILKIRNGRLEWLQIMRANDLMRGLPHNLVQFTTLQEMMATWIGCSVGSYTHLADSLHLYEHDAGGIVEVGTVSLQPNSDRWVLPFDDQLLEMQEIGRRMDILRRDRLTPGELQVAATSSSLSPAAQNLLTIVSADAARRHRLPEVAVDIASRCSNPILRQLWDRWLERTQRRRSPREASSA